MLDRGMKSILKFCQRYMEVAILIASPVADLEGGVRAVRPPLKFAKHMLYNVN